jgi:chromate transporter
VWQIGKRSLHHRTLQGIAISSFLALFVFKVPFPVVVGFAGIIGYVISQKWPSVFASKPSTTIKAATTPLIPDDVLHGEQPSLQRAIKILVVGLTFWGVPVLIAAVVFGRSHVFVQQGLFFSGTAVVTFGGAYAVLSFVAQRAVGVYHWLLPGEMVNGLALAETTPGPLIMVVQFVGFLGAFRNPGSLNPWVAALVGSTLVVWVTFVPCFLFVFLGAPHIEAMRNNKKLSGALSAIAASVVGVIANLSIYFSLHTLFDRNMVVRSGPINLDAPVWSTVNWRAVIVTVLAFVLIFRVKLSVLRVLGLCAVVGALLHLTR